MKMMEWIITSCILLVLISVIRQVFKEKLSAKVRYGIWLIVLVRLLLPVSLTGSKISVLNLFTGDRDNPQVLSDSSVMPSPVNAYENSTGITGWFTGNAESQIQNYSGISDYGAEKTGNGNDADSTGKIIPAGIWMAGMAVCGLALLGSNLIFMRKLRRSRQLIPVRQISELQDCSFIAGRIPVYTSKLVNTPCLFGLFRPAIYIRPEDKGNKASLTYILKHEYTHYRHLDHIWALCRSLCLVIHWYNPLVWAAAYWNRQDGELACDASVLAGMEDEKRLEYGRLLIELTRGNSPYGDMLCCATTMSRGKKNLKERVRRIAGYPRFFLIPTAIAVSLCLAVSWTTFTVAEKNESQKSEPQENKTQETEPRNDEVQDGDQPAEFESAERLVNVMFADVTHDGVEDAVFTTVEFFREEDAALSIEELLQNVAAVTKVRVYDGNAFFGNDSNDKEKWGQLALAGEMTGNIQYPSNQEAIWERELAIPHAGNGLVFLTWQNGEAYLLDSSAWFGQGMGEFQYEVFSLDSTGGVQEKDSGELSFSINNFAQEKWEDIFSVPDMIAYTEQIAPWIEDGVVIVITDIGYDALAGRPGQSVQIKPWEIWKGFLGDTPAGMDELEEKLEQFLQDLRSDESL